MSFPFRICAAPVAGVSNRAWRETARAFGADAAWGEMVSARAIGYGSKRTLELIDIDGEAAPRIVQLSGSEPEFIRQAAELAVSLGADIIDLNMGCPVPKVVKNGEGSMLMNDPALAVRLVQTAAVAGKPVSCKFRSGWDSVTQNAVEFAQALEQAGAAFLTIHARTRQQMYSGQADWSMIARVKQAVSLPVIGNGDIYRAADGLSMLEQTGCDGLMLGRGLFGNPWLLSELRAALNQQPLPTNPTRQQVANQALRQLARHIELTAYWVEQRDGAGEASRTLAEQLAVCSMRNQLGWYTKGRRGGSYLRGQINQAVSYNQVEQLFAAWLTTPDESEITD